MINKNLTVILIVGVTLGCFSHANAQVTKWKLEEKKTSTPLTNNKITQYDEIGNRITDKFEKWLIKGEFEKTSDYQRRVRTKSDSIFTKICMDQIGMFFYSNRVYDIEKKYDADRECFDLQWFSRNTYYWELRMDVPVGLAQRINHLISHRDNYSKPNFIFTGLTQVDGDIVPQKALFIPYHEGNILEIELYSTRYKGKPLLYSTNSLQLKHESLPLIVFNYNEAIKKEDRVRRESLQRLQVEAIREEEELAVKEAVRKNEKAEEVKVREFNRSHYGMITNEVKRQFSQWSMKSEYETDSDYQKRINESKDREFSRIVDETINFYEKQLHKTTLFGKINSYDADNEIAVITVHDEYNQPFFAKGLSVKIPKELAQIVTENLKAYHKRGCCAYGGIIVMPNKYAMVSNYYVPSQATILFFLDDRAYGMYGGSPLNSFVNNFDFSILKAKKTRRVFSKYFSGSDSKIGIPLTNINDAKAINKKNLFYEWTILDNPKYNFADVQDVKKVLTLENLR